MTPSNLIGGILFNGIGVAALIYGKKISAWKTMALGGALVLMPYLIQNTLAMYSAGILLSIALFIFHD